jgi:hypothetical protein
MKRAINTILKPLGCEIRHIPKQAPNEIGAEFMVTKYREVVGELYGCLTELLFPEIPPREGRRELLSKLIGTPVSEAMHLIAYLSRSLALEGDVCEFGIAQGATSALLANEIRDTAKRLWLFDSFQGLPPPTSKDVLINDIFGLGSIEKYAGTMAEPAERVQLRLKDIGFPEVRTKIVPGFIEKTIKSAILPDKVCFAYIDFDFYEPILTTLRFLCDRIPVGGFVIVDDYGFFSSGAKTAVDEFVVETAGNYKLTLPPKCAAEATPFCILRHER